MSIEYRHPTMDDIEAMTRVINESTRDMPLHRDQTPDEIKRWTFDEPEYRPEGYLLAFDGDEAVGLGGSFIHKSRQESNLKDAHIEINVMPEHLGKGIEQHLMKFSLDYLQANGVKYAKRWILGTEGWRHDLALEFGMKDVRHGYTMLYDKEMAPEESPLSDDFEFHHVMLPDASDAEIEDFVRTFNDSFQDHYNFSPVPVSRFIKARDEEKEDIGRLTFARKDNETAGVCYYGVAVRYNKQNNSLTGWSNILGVCKPYRRNGLGRALLSHSMRWMWDQGMRDLYLGMDAENHKALDLYLSLGYQVKQESITYELEL